MADVVRLRDLGVWSAAGPVVDGVALELVAGRVVGLVGASGCGKTVTARALLGLVDVRPGVVRADLEIDVGGRVWRPWDDVLRRGIPSGRAFRAVRGDVIGYLPQDARAALDPLRRVGPQVAVAARLGGDRGDPRRWLERAGLADADRVVDLYPHELSGGMAQRVVIAQALARGSRFLLADEPTTGLDLTVQVPILAQLRALADRGVGVLLITHDLRVLPGLADEVVLMDRGRVVEATSAEALVQGGVTSEVGRALVEATRRVAAGRLG